MAVGLAVRGFVTTSEAPGHVDRTGLDPARSGLTYTDVISPQAGENAVENGDSHRISRLASKWTGADELRSVARSEVRAGGQRQRIAIPKPASSRMKPATRFP